MISQILPVRHNAFNRISHTHRKQKRSIILLIMPFFILTSIFPAFFLLFLKILVFLHPIPVFCQKQAKE